MTEPQNTSASDRVYIFDTTLRDGEQCARRLDELEEKLEVAEILDALGVDIIEAGFPSPRRAISNPCRRSPAG